MGHYPELRIVLNITLTVVLNKTLRHTLDNCDRGIPYVDRHTGARSVNKEVRRKRRHSENIFL